jgi:cytosine/adenosine deaminase-related metal-dependent hydrolase
LNRKFKADHIFNGYEILPGNNILIADTKGIVIDIIDEKDAGDNIEIFSGLLTPGFINCHCHIELSHMKGLIPSGTGLVEFVQQVMKKRVDANELKEEAILNAESELHDSGTIAVGDICNTIDSIPVKRKSKLYWHNFIEVSGFVDDYAEKRLNDAKTIISKFSNPKSLSPHAPYSVSKTLFQLLNNETSNQLITIHNQECTAEDELSKNKSGNFLNLYQNFGIDISAFKPTGRSSLQSWFPYFKNNQSFILVHNTFISQSDIDFLKLSIINYPLSIAFCVCPNANQYIEQKIPPLELLRKNNCNIVIGTDSYASNWQLNILEEIKTIQQKTNSTISLQEILQWATINGAKALQIDNTTGSFEKGKQSGIVLIDKIIDLNVTKDSSAKRLL